MDNIEPPQDVYNDVEQLAIDVLQQSAPTVMTKTGSVVRELVVRPLSYITSWAISNISSIMRNYNLSYLAGSMAKDNFICDSIASTFFVYRKQGSTSNGILTVTLTMPVVTIPSGSTFSLNGVNVRTTQQVVITSAAFTNNVFDNVTYIISTKVGNKYIANLPVEAEEEGPIEVPVDTPVSMQFTCNGLESAELTSAITGGSGVETDAMLMARAGVRATTSGIGTYYGILKKLGDAPITVIGMSVVAGEDIAMYRGRYNTTNINRGGVVDCYVKLANQPTTMYVTATCNDNCIILDNKEYANILAVNEVIVNGEYLSSISVDFDTADDNVVDAVGARLSSYQITKIHTNSVPNGAEATVSITYVPGVNTLQQFLDSDEEKFIGQDTKVKAAVPVMVSVNCCAYSLSAITDDVIDTIKDTISSVINNAPVGSATINYSDIIEACSTVLPDIELRLPCVFSCFMFLKDGSTDSFYSNTGILDIANTANKGYWDYSACYFTTCSDNIRIEVL